MPVIEEKKAVKKGEQFHNVSMENRNYLNISGVEDVDNFDEENVELYTTVGMMTVTGSGLHITKLNVESGEVAIEGEIQAVEYSDGEFKKGGAGFFSRLFK
ncbi:Spore protein YabP [bioreactor metagenome]|uniref:Spore protein YabP n=1 Tax=bioreactor metagenome TaxID=1076179 RepID=A0A645G344_9ZZZZ